MWLFVIVAFAILIFFAIDWQLRWRFEEAWPAIDDDEFLRRCPPGTDRETALTVRKIIAEQLGIPYFRISPEQRFVEDLNLD